MSIARTRNVASVLLAMFAVGCESDPSPNNPVTPPAVTPDLDGGGGGGDPADPSPDELASGGACPAPAGAGTEHKGIIAADETWTAATGPHKVTFGLDILAKVTLEPCTVVQVAKDIRISIGSTSAAGSLVARGTSEIVNGQRQVRPVRFVELEPGSGWGQLLVEPKGTLDLSIAALQDGGGETNNQRGALVVYGVAGGTNDGEITRSAKVDRVLIDKSRSYGVNLEAWGAFAEGSDKLWIRGSGSADFPSAIRLEGGVASTLPKTLSATGNVKDEILILSSKAFMRSDTLVSRGVPYRQKGALYVQPSADGAPVKLTIEAGVTIGFEVNAGSGMYIGGSEARQGILEAVGTAAAPIVFTSAKPTKAPGDWMSLYFGSTPKTGSKISFARIEYAGGESGSNGFGCGPGDNDGAVQIFGTGAESGGPSAPFIDHTTFENIAGTTVIVSGWVDDAGPNFTGDNTFGSGIPSCRVSKPRRTGAGDVCDGGRTTCW